MVLRPDQLYYGLPVGRILMAMQIIEIVLMSTENWFMMFPAAVDISLFVRNLFKIKNLQIVQMIVCLCKSCLNSFLLQSECDLYQRTNFHFESHLV